MSKRPFFRACLFDLDGTLVNSEPAVNRCWSELFLRYGLDSEPNLMRVHGRPASESITEILSEIGAETQIEEEIDWLKRKESTDVEGVVPIDGAVAFLRQLDDCEIPWAIVTSGALPVASARIKAGGIPMPKLLITCDDITKGKPDPEPYLLASQRLQIAPRDCLVFEDAAAGIKAGQAAGSRVVGIDACQPIAEPGTLAVVQSYKSLSIEPWDDGFALLMSH